MTNRFGNSRFHDFDDTELKAEIDSIASRIDQIIQTVKEFFPTGESSTHSDPRPDKDTIVTTI